MPSPLLLSTIVLLASCLIQGEEQTRDTLKKPHAPAFTAGHPVLSGSQHAEVRAAGIVGGEARKTRSVGGGNNIDPTAIIDRHAIIGSGLIIKANARVEYMASVGDGSIISENCVVGRYAKVGRGAIMMQSSRLRPYSSLADGSIMQPGEVR